MGYILWLWIFLHDLTHKCVGCNRYAIDWWQCWGWIVLWRWRKCCNIWGRRRVMWCEDKLNPPKSNSQIQVLYTYKGQDMCICTIFVYFPISLQSFCFWRMMDFLAVAYMYNSHKHKCHRGWTKTQMTALHQNRPDKAYEWQRKAKWDKTCHTYNSSRLLIGALSFWCASITTSDDCCCLWRHFLSPYRPFVLFSTCCNFMCPHILAISTYIKAYSICHALYSSKWMTSRKVLICSKLWKYMVAKSSALWDIIYDKVVGIIGTNHCST